MTDDDLFKLFWGCHKERLLSFAVKAAFGNRRDAEDGLNDAIFSLWREVLEHFKSVSIEDRTDAKKSIVPLLWTRIRDRVLDARRKSLRHEQPLGQPVVPVEALADLPTKTSNDSTDAAVERLASKWNRLSDTEKKVILLTKLREPPMTDDEAAKEIGKTPGCVKTARYNALKQLRQ
jgi:RNA polymerase sigma factor (sigma-70 family)